MWLTVRKYALTILGLLLMAAGLTYALAHPGGQKSGRTVSMAGPAGAPAAAGGIRFSDIRAQSGIGYRWVLHAPKGLNALQSLGSGCALLDYDNDGNLDVLLIGPTPALYRGDGHGHFTDVTHQTGLDRLHGHFTGCAVGDYDNDGYDDLYLCAYHGGVLLHNESGKRFTDVTAKMGIKAQPFGTSATFADMDGDGRLDLFICNYITWNLPKTDDPELKLLGEYPVLNGVLYHNEGGRFRDVTAPWNLTRDRVHGRGLGVTAADFDGSGRQALFVANDMNPNDLLLRDGGKGCNLAGKAGVALGDLNFRRDGLENSNMGVDWGDYDNDGRLDLIVTTFRDETKSAYHNEGAGLFTNKAAQLGIRAALPPNLSWGVKWADFDNDGFLDLIVANGHLSDRPPDLETDRETFKQPTKLLRNLGGTRFVDISNAVGPDITLPIMGRGLAIGDFDNDGRMDALVVDNDGRPLLLHNETSGAGHWLMCRLIGVKSNRDGIGALLTFEAGGRKSLRCCHTDGSYMSASDKRVHCGLGKATEANITVRWPSGHTDVYRDVRADRIVTLTEGGQTAN